MLTACSPVALVPCAGARRARAPLPENGGNEDADDKAARNKALGLDPGTSLPRKTGVLNKRGEALFRGWAERLVVLDEISLRYYDVSYRDADSWPASSARGLIPLTSQSRVHKLEGDLAPRSRGAGLDWKGAVTDGKGMPFCFKVQTADNEYVFQATNENERSSWIGALHSRIEYLARQDPRAQHQHEIVNGKSSRSGTGASSPLSGRSSPAQDDEDEEEDEEEISDMMMTDGLSAQLKLALKGQKRQEARTRSNNSKKTDKAGDEASKRRQGHQNRGKGGQDSADKAWKQQPPPPKGIFGRQLPDISSGWCSAPDLTPSWLRLCDGKGKDGQGEGVMSPVLSPRSGDEEERYPGQINGTGGRAYQPSTVTHKGRDKGAKQREGPPQPSAAAAAAAAEAAPPTTPGGSPYVAAPAFVKKGAAHAKSNGQAKTSAAGGGEAQGQEGGRVGWRGEAGAGAGAGAGAVVMEAIYDFVPEQPDEMQMAAGDRVVVQKEFEDGWCSVRLLVPGGARREKGVRLLGEGIVPRSYLQLLPTQDAQDTATPSDADAAGVFGAACEPEPKRSSKSALPSALKGSRKEREAAAQQVRLYTPAGGFDDPERVGTGDEGHRGEHGPVLSLLRKKAMSWRDKSEQAPPEPRPQQGARARASASPQKPRLESEEEMSASTDDDLVDETEQAAIAARAAKKGSPGAAKPPLAAGSSARGRRQDDGAEAADSKEKKKSLLSRNPRKMLGKIAARVRSRSASREPTPRSSPQ